MPNSLLTLRPLDTSRWAWVMETDGRLQSGEASAAGLPRLSPPGRTRLLLPGDWVTHAQTTIAAKNPRLIAQALPFALEEQLAEDIEQLRIAHGPRAPDGRLEARIIRRATLDALLADLAEAGIQPDGVFSELDALPHPAQGWTTLALPGLALARAADGQALALEANLLTPLLNGANIVELTAPEGPWVWLHRHLREREAIDLMGDHRRASALGERLRPWRIPAAIAASALVLQASLMAFETHQLNQQRATMQADIERLAREAAPDVRRWINPLAQLRQLAGGEVASPDHAGMLALLSAVAPALGGQNTVKPGMLRYHNRALEVHLSANDSAALERLLDTLRKQSGLQAELADQRVEGGQATARLRIKEAQG
ncbi:MAG: type II secretion system protein GspL [Pseudomonadota bacterium]